MLAVTTGNAKAHKYYKYHHKPPAHAWVVPPAAGKSTWCKKNPKKCYNRGKHDPKINTSWEHCVDKKANGDGYVSKWEIKQFGSTCNP